MQVRLGFAVAAHLEPDILLVDEVLAVGDAAFQEKCLGKMGDVAREGRTVIFVSHNMGSVRSLCERCILLRNGRLERDGDPVDVTSHYLSSGLTAGGLEGEVCWLDSTRAPGGDEVRLRSIRVLGANGSVRPIFEPEEPIRVEITYRVLKRVMGMRMVVHLIDEQGGVVLASTDHDTREAEVYPGTYRTVCEIPACLLNTRRYFIAVNCGIPGVRVLVPKGHFLAFDVAGAGLHGSCYPEAWPGAVAPRLRWQTEQVPEEQ